MPHDHVKKIDPLFTPAPQRPTPGACYDDPDDRKMIVLYLSFVRTHSMFGLKNL